MPYEMNEGGFLSGSFIADQYNRNQEWEDMRRANAAAESYWKQLKMQQEIEMEIEKRKNLADISSALTPTMRKKSVRQNGDGTLTIEYEEPKAEKASKDYQPITFEDGSLGSFDKTTNAYYDALGNQITDPKRYIRKESRDYQPITFEDGSLGSFDKTTKTYYDATGNQVTDPKRYIRQTDPSWQIQTLGDGTVVQINPKTGKARPITMNGQPLIGKTASDHEAAREAERQRQTAKQAAMADITDAIRNGTPQEQADARASRRLMAQTGRVGMIETTPNEVQWSHPAIQGTGLRGYMGIGYPSQPAEVGTFSMPPTVTTNWYDQVLGTSPQGGMPTNAVPSASAGPKVYATESDVMAAASRGEIRQGDVIIVNGRKAVWE